MEDTKPTVPASLTVGVVMLVIALTAQGVMAFEVFEVGSVAAKITQVIGFVLTGLGFNVARKVAP